MKHWLNHFLFVSLIILFSGTHANTTPRESDTCITCHNSNFNASLNNVTIHPPYLEKKCGFCHLEESSSSLTNKSMSNRSNRSKINWLQNNYEPATNHFFLVPAAKVDDTLFIQIEGSQGRSKTTSLSLPPLKQLPQLANDGKQPKISGIKYHGINKGILYSATISWKTDEPTDAQIHYGIGSFDQRTRIAPQLKRNHTIVISPVIPDKTYNYTVISKDMHGNRTISQPLSFSTKKTNLRKTSNDIPVKGRSSAKDEFNYTLAALDNYYFISLTTNQATSMNVGGNRDLRKQIDIPADKLSQQAKHATIKTNYDTNITSCLECHKDYQSESSHPINVKPKRGMTFPKDYPVLDNGRMHCMTCHEAHASHNEARIRRSTKKDLCVGCHANYG